MELLHTTRALQARADALRAQGLKKCLALVPTMGALHRGHLALVDAARLRADFVIVSIFVNPTQFETGPAHASYPRTLDADLARCRAHGVDAVFLPTDDELYPPGAESWVELPALSKLLEGAKRPGHFRGVATVVTKLLIAAKPHFACFGEKDFQQLLLIRRLVRDLCFDVEIVGVPTLREADGLALSSRNRLLSPDARAQAPVLSRALDAAEASWRAGERASPALLQQARLELEKAPLLRSDYLALCDPETLAPLPALCSGSALLALAAHFPAATGGGEVRLIDNRVLRAPGGD